jgi:hypothetical protein
MEDEMNIDEILEEMKYRERKRVRKIWIDFCTQAQIIIGIGLFLMFACIVFGIIFAYRID